MVDKTNNNFRPEYAIPPGETLQETLDAIGMTQAELSERTGRPRKTINEIVKGKTAITPETALQLERVLRVPAGFWMNLEAQFQEGIALIQEESDLESQLEWLDRFPSREMIHLGWISKQETKVDQLRVLLTFLGATSAPRWEELWASSRASFRMSPSFDTDLPALAAWLRKGEIEAQRMVTREYSRSQFRESLHQIRGLTLLPPERFVGKMQELCAEAGVVFLFVRELPKIRTFGATRWLSPKKALIQLTLRYRSDDQLWFSFFHEAAHIVLHGKRDVFIEGVSADTNEEAQANKFAEEFLIPRSDLSRFIASGKKSKNSIRNFASELGIAPGIVVGQLQHIGYLPMSHCNDLKIRFEWSESLLQSTPSSDDPIAH